MLRVGEIFEAQAASLWDTLNCHGGSSGFRIPEYQRTYDWSTERVGRLLEDCANGFAQLRKLGTAESYTFLGTLILVNEKSETTFDGKSLAIVDGQQRLTTLLLICCALVEKISASLGTAEHLSPPAKTLILGEAGHHIGKLFACIVGKLQSFQQTGRYPRIIRHEDKRATEKIDAHYQSTIARFLIGFADHYSGANLMRKEFEFQLAADDNKSSKRLLESYKYVKQQIACVAGLSAQESTDDDAPYFEVVQSHEFARKGFTSLLSRIDRGNDEDEVIVSAISSEGPSNVLTRLVLFASYVSQCVVLTRVEAEDEDSAFDIFDALNTTGEPLTAIETFKPLVIQNEAKEAVGYRGSESEVEFDQIAKIFGKIEKPADRQSEAREIVISFALYASGEKVPKDLRSQRRYLRRSYDRHCDTLESKRRFVKSLAEITRFRDECWSRDGIRETPSLEPDTRLCLQVIRDMNTSLALPAIARYWAADPSDDEQVLMQAVRALTAFLILRRSVTGSTGGIDGVFRSMMKQGNDYGGPLCCGLKSENRLLGIGNIRTHLRSLLAEKNIGVKSKEQWVQAAKDTPVGRHTSPLAKFLILAASQYARRDTESRGLLTREGFRESREQQYLTYETWTSAEYKTVEHVAPSTNPGHGWDPDIYGRQRFTKDTVGNLVLLPQKENASLGNSPWRRKRLFYLALMATDSEEQERWLREADAAGLEFPKTTRTLLRKGRRLHLLDPLREVEEWDERLIRARTENILSLAWDTIAPWLWD
ncbi:MAG: DUF262 domain-containing HNH endonuclease family protein [Gammaproteobacteria bacterium]|nr:DUF262 domain-containing HNH endonuclease family protein [Gammaproteobacteria bacterium]